MSARTTEVPTYAVLPLQPTFRHASRVVAGREARVVLVLDCPGGRPRSRGVRAANAFYRAAARTGLPSRFWGVHHGTHTARVEAHFDLTRGGVAARAAVDHALTCALATLLDDYC